MMRRATAVNAAAALCAAAALAAGCSSSPQSNFYTLRSVAAAKPAESSSKISVVVGPVSIPAIVNAPQIVVRTGPNQVTPDEFNRWASPLQDNVSQVVAEDLVALLGTPRVTLFQQALGADADYRVAIEIQAFESAPGEEARLDAAWIVRRIKDGASQSGRTDVREPLAEKGYSALAAAHSRALARLSQDVADAIRTLASASP